MSEVAYTLDRESGVATLVIDTAGPVNSIGQQFITDLERATARANRDQVRGVIIASAKRRSFLDGANLQEITTNATPQLLRTVLQRYQDALAALAKSPFPVVAVLKDQTALGGGLELLLWSCDHVFCTSGCKMGLPEVNVGLFPAGGGTQTLKRIVGFEAAIDMILTGRVSSPDAFADTGFVTVCPSSELTSRALAWLADHQGITNRNYDPGYKEPKPISDEEKQKAINKARFRYTISPYRPYLLAAVEALEAGLKLPFDDAVCNEIDLFVPLFDQPNTKNKISLFFLTTSIGPRLARVNPGDAVRVDRLAVIGGGLMGRGIAQVAADKGAKVTILDVDEETTKSALEKIDRSLEDLVAKGRWSQERRTALMSNMSWATDYGQIKDVPLVIESVFEDLAVKRQVLARVQEVNPNAIFASNTSTLPMARISEGAVRPEQVVGMHYFSPVPLMPLLEVIEGPRSSAASVATAVTAGRAMGKTVILVGDGPGFYTSRTFGMYVTSGFLLAELGLSPWDVDMMALQVGFPQGPLHVYGTAGGNVIFHAGSFLAECFPERMQLPESLAKLYGAGYVGAGKPSFYLDERKMTRDETVLEHIVHFQGLPTPTKEEAQDILLLGMVNEAFWCMSEGVLRDYFSMDLGAVLGIGFPDCWHGPAKYVSLRGVKAVKARLEELAEKFTLARLTPAPEFDVLIACGLDSHLI